MCQVKSWLVHIILPAIRFITAIIPLVLGVEMQSLSLDRRWNILIFALTMLWGLNILKLVANDDSKLQWDFQTYYYASVAHDAGLNPYDTNNLSQLAHKTILLDYVYPPYVNRRHIPTSKRAA